MPYQGVAGGYVKATGGNGSIVVPEGNSYRAGDVSVPADRAAGLNAGALASSATKKMVTDLNDLGLLDYVQPEADVRAVLDAFTGAGSPQVYYNDPRFINDGTIRFWPGHFNHMHFDVPHPILYGNSHQGGSELSGSGGGNLGPAGTIDLGRLGATQVVSGSLNATNPEQIYRFEIGDVSDESYQRQFFGTPRDLSLLLNDLSDNADLELIEDLNEDNVLDVAEVLFDSTTTGDAAETINATGLPTGVYYVRVFKQAGNTDFDLTLTVAALPVPPDHAGNSLSAAADLGTVAGSVNRSDFLGEVDTDDFYRFQLSTMSDLALTLNGLAQGDVMVEVGRDANLDGVLDFDEILAYSDAEGNDAESLQLDRLPAGDYVLWVSRVSGNTDYQLQLSSATSVIPVDNAGDTVATALDVGSLLATVNLSEFVGDVDPIDLYRFSLTQLKAVAINLSGLSNDADLEIARDSNGDGTLDASELLASSRQAGTNSDLISLAGLAPGDYFVRVVQYEGDTVYSLSLTPATAYGADLAVTRTDSGGAADLGSQFTYVLKVANNGPDTATNVTLTETLPVGLKLIYVQKSDPSSSVQISGNRITGRIPSLAQGASASFSITVSSFIAGELLTATNVVAATTDFDLSNNRLENGKRINAIASPPADLELTQTVSNLNPSIGERLTITLSLTNKGPGTATVIQVRDILPVGLMYVSSGADLGTYNSTTGIWNVGNMPPNVTVRLRIFAEVASGTSLTNAAEVVAVDEPDPDSTPNNNDPSEDDQTSVTLQGGGASIRDDPLNPGQKMLVVEGTAGADVIIISSTDNGIEVQYNSDSALFADPIGRILVHGREGDDRIELYRLRTFNGSVIVRGGDGDDVITGSAGNDILLGEAGNDIILSGLGDNVIIAGLGCDRVYGSFGQDLLVAGRTVYDDNDEALLAIEDEWTSGKDYLTRIGNITGENPLAGRLNHDFYFTKGTTVFDDGDKDVVYGGQGRDWFFFDPDKDQVLLMPDERGN